MSILPLPGSRSSAAVDARPAPGEPVPPDDRRNHYRVLHVQPEAPLEVIKASYRTLMSRLRLHPDLGGNHAEACRVNLAWAVLSQPERRRDYDRLLQQQRTPALQRAIAEAPRRDGASATAGGPIATARPMRAQAAAQAGCPLCALAITLLSPRSDSRCNRCQAPLAALPGPGSQAHELLGRRGATRRDQDHLAMLRVGWPAPALPVRWRDLSLSGLSLFVPAPIATGQRMHLIDSALEAVAEVVGSRPQGRLYTVHARLLTALLLQSTGVFVSARA